MQVTTGAQLIVKTLEAEGVRHVFGNPGTYEIELLDSLVGHPSITYLLSLHEQATVSMADGYARVTGRPAFVNLHGVVGTTNGLGALFTAAKDRTPLVVTAGVHDTRHLFRDGYGELPGLVPSVRPYTKHAVQVPRLDRIPEELVRAFKVAATSPSGPTFLAIPRDFFTETAAVPIPDPAGFRLPTRVPPNPDDVDRAADLLLAAERAVLVAGGDVHGDGGSPLLAELAELLALPIFSEHFPAFLGVATTHPHYLGLYAPGHPEVAGAGAVLGVGCRMFVEPEPPRGAMVPEGAAVVHVHRDPWEVARVWPTTVGLVADARSALAALLTAARRRMTASQAAAIARRRPARAAARAAWDAGRRALRAEDSSATPIKPWRVASELSRVLPADGLVVNQAVTMGNYILNLVDFSRPGAHAMTASTYMGWATGAAIGMKLGAPARPVVCCVGDGGLVYGAQALWTAAHDRVPVVFLVLDNQRYGAIRSFLHDRGGEARRAARYPGAELLDPPLDLVRLAEGLGVEAVRIERPEEIRPALERALGGSRAIVLDVLIDPDELGAHRVKAPAAAKAAGTAKGD
jgi:benzoylformate decarboxylase